jgi:prenylcysteine oxidase/farnesylcysteine lyase
MLSAILLSFQLFQLSEALHTPFQQSILDVGANSTSLSRPKKIAIIGSGIAGAIAAYTLREESRIHQLDVGISVFEAQSRIGGRLGYTDRMEPSPFVLNVGTLSFTEQDWCINEAIRSVGLSTSPTPLQGSLGIWNGKEFINKQDPDYDHSSWWNLGKMIWRYGMSSWILQQAMEQDLDKWQKFHSYSTFTSISQKFDKIGFIRNVQQSADIYLQNLNISELFRKEAVEPMIRFRSHRNLSEVLALEMLLAISNRRRQRVLNGNTRLIERLFVISGADVAINTTIEVVSTGNQRRYRLGIPNNGNKAKYSEYDAVIIAAPFQSNGITFDGFSTQQSALRPYIQIHTTDIISRNKFSPTFFNISASEIPSNILTTSTHNSTLGFHSIQYLGRYPHRLQCGTPPEPGCDLVEFAQHYRVISTEEIRNATVSALTGTPGPNLDEESVHWTHQEAWKYGAPKYDSKYQLFDKVELAPSLLYTSGAEEVVSSLEMACRVARNAARTLVWVRWRDFEL